MPEQGNEYDLDTPWRRDLDEIQPALTAWALARFAEPVEVVNVTSPGNGMSSETVLFDVQNLAEGSIDRYVARLAPLPELYPVFPDYDLELQRKCMDLVRAGTDVPAPEVAFFERDAEWLGTPFLVMRRIGGTAPPDIPPYVFEGWILDASPEERRRLQDASVSLLARLHEITPATHDLSFLARPDFGASALDQQLGYQRWYYEWARNGVSYPLIERTLAWLEEHRPPEGDAGAQLGRRPHRQRALRRLRTGRGARLGDGDDRPPRGRRRVDDLPRHLLRRPRRALRAAGARGVHGPRRRRRHLRVAHRAHRARARVVRGARRAALRDRVGAHQHPRHRLRADGAARRARRPHHVPQPAGADARPAERPERPRCPGPSRIAGSRPSVRRGQG